MLLPPLFFRFPFLHKSKNPKRFSPRRECLTQTRGSDQMELSQGCPVDCDTCMWVRVFHCHYIVVVSEKDRNACIVIMNRMLLFFSFKMHLHTEYTAKADLILESSGKNSIFSGLFCLSNAETPTQWSHAGVLLRLRQVWCGEIQHRQVDNRWKREKKKMPTLSSFPFI